MKQVTLEESGILLAAQPAHSCPGYSIRRQQHRLFCIDSGEINLVASSLEKENQQIRALVRVGALRSAPSDSMILVLFSWLGSKRMIARSERNEDNCTIRKQQEHLGEPPKAECSCRNRTKEQ